MDPIVHDLNEGWRRALRLQRFVYELRYAAQRSRSVTKSWWFDQDARPPAGGTVVTVSMTEDQIEAYRRVMKMLEEFDPSGES